MKSGRPTISDVANSAGVSTATVSRVLSGGGTVTGELRARVLAAVEQLNYTPQRVRHPQEAQVWLPVFVRHTITQFDLQVIAGIQEEAELSGMLTTIMRLTDGSTQLADMLQQLRCLPLAGVVALNTFLEPAAFIHHAEASGLPIVVLNTEVHHPRIVSILVDFSAAARRATQHLLDLGHTRVAYVGDFEHDPSASELAGVASALASRGLPYPDEYRISVPLTPEGASQGVSRLMNLPPGKRPTAIFAFDDEVAIDIINALRYYGVRVPQDMSLVGFDNIPMAAHTYPPLTTLDVPKERMGRQMVALLERLNWSGGRHWEPEGGLGTVVVDPGLLVRGSTGPAPAQPGG